MPLSARFIEALAYAADLHATQVRKGTDIPYISHLLAVTALVLEHGGTEDEAIAALLHDAIEDQGGGSTREVIRAKFGEDVVAIVDGCTDTEVTPKPPWRARKEEYLHHLTGAPKSVALVAAADKLHNARSTLADLRGEGDAVWARFNAGREEQLWFYRGCVEALRCRAPAPLVDELARVVDAMAGPFKTAEQPA